MIQCQCSCVGQGKKNKMSLRVGEIAADLEVDGPNEAVQEEAQHTTSRMKLGDGGERKLFGGIRSRVQSTGDGVRGTEYGGRSTAGSIYLVQLQAIAA